jgi:hypothetical protein
VIFPATLRERDRSLPLYVAREFEAFLNCGRLGSMIARARPCDKVQAGSFMNTLKAEAMYLAGTMSHY